MNAVDGERNVLGNVTGTQEISVERVNRAIVADRVHRGKSCLRHDLSAKNPSMRLPLAGRCENVFACARR